MAAADTLSKSGLAPVPPITHLSPAASAIGAIAFDASTGILVATLIGTAL